MRPINEIDPGSSPHCTRNSVMARALRGGAMRVGWKVGLGVHDAQGQIGADIPVSVT